MMQGITATMSGIGNCAAKATFAFAQDLRLKREQAVAPSRLKS